MALKEAIKLFGNLHSVLAYRGIPYATAKRFADPIVCEFTSGTKFNEEKVTPHFPQPDEFNKSNWKSLPRTIKESQVSVEITSGLG